MKFSFLPAVIFLYVVCVQSGKNREFLKSLLHGFLITLLFAAFSSIFLPLVTSADLSDIPFLMRIVLYLYWIFLIYAFLTGIVIFFVRKLKSKRCHHSVYGIATVVLGTGFCVGHYIIARAVAEAIYIGIMMSH